jgi:hypothetical protein
MRTLSVNILRRYKPTTLAAIIADMTDEYERLTIDEYEFQNAAMQMLVANVGEDEADAMVRHELGSGDTEKAAKLKAAQ